MISRLRVRNAGRFAAIGASLALLCDVVSASAAPPVNARVPEAQAQGAAGQGPSTTVQLPTFGISIDADGLLKLRSIADAGGQLRRERDAIAALRAEWAKLDTPGRIQGLADRHLALQPMLPTQFDSLDKLPERPPAAAPNSDPIGAMLTPPASDITGSLPARR